MNSPEVDYNPNCWNLSPSKQQNSDSDEDNGVEESPLRVFNGTSKIGSEPLDFLDNKREN